MLDRVSIKKPGGVSIAEPRADLRFLASGASHAAGKTPECHRVTLNRASECDSAVKLTRKISYVGEAVTKAAIGGQFFLFWAVNRYAARNRHV